MKQKTIKQMFMALMLGAATGLNAQALDPNLLKYVAVADTILTESIIDNDYNPLPWEEKGRHAGMQAAQFTLFTKRADKRYDVPEYVDMYIRLKNCYGELMTEEHDDVYPALSFIADGDADFSVLTLKYFIEQGGEYVFERGIPWLGIERSNEFTLVDEPSVRYNGFAQLKTGSDLNAFTLFNTGYPYDHSRLTGQEKAVWSLRYQAPDAKDPVEIDKGEMALTFDNSQKPRLAAIDTLKIFKSKPALGQYFFDLQTNWDKEKLGDMASRISRFQVVDTLRATATIDKEQYKMGVDKQLVVNLSLDYGYPFIHTTAPDEVPTVRIRYQINAGGETVFSDSLKIADQNLAVEPLQRNDQLVMTFDNVTDKVFGTSDQTEIYVRVTVEFDGNVQYTADFRPTLLRSESTVGINESQFADKKSSDGISFDLQGRSVGKNPNKGVYIQDGKKVIIK